MSEKSRLETYLPLLIAIVGVVSALLGAGASHVWTRSLKLEEEAVNIRKSAYSDFFRGQILLQAGKSDEANPIINSAKLNILLTSSPGVICAMTSYWISAFKYEECKDPELRKKDAAIYQQMRHEFFKTFNIAESPNIESAVVVPYLWSCYLPGQPGEQVCKGY